jgi:hypothetical protein
MGETPTKEGGERDDGGIHLVCLVYLVGLVDLGFWLNEANRVLTIYLSRTAMHGLDTRRPVQKPSQAVQKGRPASDEAKGVLSVVR